MYLPTTGFKITVVILIKENIGSKDTQSQELFINVMVILTDGLNKEANLTALSKIFFFLAYAILLIHYFRDKTINRMDYKIQI